MLPQKTGEIPSMNSSFCLRLWSSISLAVFLSCLWTIVWPRPVSSSLPLMWSSHLDCQPYEFHPCLASPTIMQPVPCNKSHVWVSVYNHELYNRILVNNEPDMHCGPRRLNNISGTNNGEMVMLLTRTQLPEV